MDQVRKETRADQAIAKYGVTGKGVVVAILDRGIDWQDPDFIKPDGKTRIKWLLDMSGQRGCAANNPAPVEYSEAQINAALAGGAPIVHRDAVGHGTVTVGIAAGNGRAFADGKYRGIAPEADLIIAKVTSEGAAAHDGEPEEAAFNACTDQALDWVDQKITSVGEPAVLLINSGVQAGPLDGTSAVSRKIEQLFGSTRPGRIYVSASGDEGELDTHAGGSYDATAGTAVRIAKSRTDATALHIWYTGAAPAQVTVSFDDGTTVGPVSPLGNVNQNGILITQYEPGKEPYPYTATGGDRLVIIQVTGHPGNGTVTIRALQAGAGRVDLYVPGLGPAIIFTDHLVPGRLNDYSTTRAAIVDACYVVRTAYTDIDGVARSITAQGLTGEFWKGSGIGPTRDGRLYGVDVATPGQNLFGSYARKSFFGTFRFNLVQDGGGWYGRQGATSGAAPILVGAIALMLQMKPGLTGQEVRQIVRNSAFADAFTGPIPNVKWGYGKLDILKALDTLSGVPSPVPAISPGGVVNAATFAAGAPVAPGSIISIFGSNFATAPAQATFTPLPPTLLNTSVTINAVSAPLYYVSPTQINAQVPFETLPGTATLAVTVNGALSPAVTFPVAATAPGIFLYGANRAVAQNLDGSINASDHPAKPGDVIVVYMTGQGAVSNPVPTGAPALGSPLSRALAATTATIGSASAEVFFSGLAPGFVGLLQVNIRVPNVAAGDQPLVVTIGAAASKSALITVASP